MRLVASNYLNIKEFGTVKGCQLADALFFVLEGNFELIVKGRKTVVGKNELVSFPENMYFERHVKTPLSFYYVKLEGYGTMPEGKVALDNPIRALSSFNLLHSAYQNGNNRLANHFLKDIFMQIEAENSICSVSHDKITESAITFFRENLNSKITLSKITSHLGISKTSLIGHFKNDLGQTPLHYLVLLRLELAEKLLLTTDMTLSEIAAECGYDTPFYLSNAFKKEKGVSPKIYRKSYMI